MGDELGAVETSGECLGVGGAAPDGAEAARLVATGAGRLRADVAPGGARVRE